MKKIFFILTFLCFLFSFSFSQSELGINQNINSNESKGLEFTEACSENESENSIGLVENKSPFEAVKCKKEDLRKRNAYSKHYINEDGSYIALIGAGPIHYLSSNGKWEDISHRILATSNPDYKFANTTNVLESHFGTKLQNGIISKTAEGEIKEFLSPKMYWEVNGQAVQLQTANNVSVSVNKDKAVYKNVFGNISAEYTVKSGQRKLNYIIPDRQSLGVIPDDAEYLVFTEEIKLPENLKIVNGLKQYNRLKKEYNTIPGVFIVDNLDKVIYEYSAPAIIENYASDVTGLPSQIMPEISFTNEQGVITIYVKVKANWIRSDERKYPIAIDPTSTAYPFTTNFSSGQTYSSGGGPGNIAAGYNGGWYRGWATFNLSSLPSMTNITEAKIYLYIGSKGGTMSGTTYTIYVGHTSFDLSRLVWISNYEVLYNAIVAANNALGAYCYMPNKNVNTWADISLKYGTSTVAFKEIERKSGSDVAFFPVSFSPAWGTGTTTRYYVIRGFSDVNKPYLQITYTEDKYKHAAYRYANAAAVGDVGYVQIGNVSIGSINNSTAITNYAANASTIYKNTPTGYNKYDLTTDVEIGNTYTLNTTYRDLGSPYNPGKIAVWVDWNEDGDFADANEFIGVSDNTTSGNQVKTFSITVPIGTTIGIKRLRIRSFLQDDIVDASKYDETFDYGETEDYNLNVVQPLLPIPVFHNYGGSAQLTFNNSKIKKIDNGFTFRLSHQGYSATVYEIQISPNFNFSSGNITQSFSGTYPADTETNFKFTSGSFVNKTTYYVKARAKASNDIWSDWTNELYSFTYDTSITIPEWFQTTTPQFNTDVLVGLINQNDELKPEASSNVIVNGNFANTSGWTTYKTSGTDALIEVSSSDCVNCPPGTTRNLKMFIWRDYGQYAMSGDLLVVSQQVDLTGVDQITYNANSYNGPNGLDLGGPVSNLRFIIGGTSTNDAGTVMHTTNQAYCPTYCTANVTDNNVVVNTTAFNGIQTIKFVMKFNTIVTTDGLIAFYVNNVVGSSASSSFITSTPAHILSVQNAVGYDKFRWNQTLGTGNIKITIQGSTDGVNFSNIVGFVDMAAPSGNGEKYFDISSISQTQYPYLRAFITLKGQDVRLHDFAFTYRLDDNLPVTLLSFTSECENDKINFAWSTASEINSDYFEIIETTDFENFNSLVKIPAAGFSSKVINYKYQTEANQGKTYYQLKQYDFDGKWEMLSTIVANCEENIYKEIYVYPIPANESINILFPTDYIDVRISIIDITGKQILTKDIGNIPQGEIINLPASHFPKGTYTLNIISKYSSQAKLIVIN